LPGATVPFTKHEYPALGAASISTPSFQLTALSVEAFTVVLNRPAVVRDVIKAGDRMHG
jgi:hypothetical protein